MPAVLQLPVDPAIIREADHIREGRVMLDDIVDHLLKTPQHEAGGFILFKEGQMRFVATENSIEKPFRGGLFEPSDDDMKRVWDLNDQGWDVVASVHSHPTFAPYPSGIDINQLFPNQRINLIVSFLGGGQIRYYDCRGVDLYPGKDQKAVPVLWAHEPRRK